MFKFIASCTGTISVLPFFASAAKLDAKAAAVEHAFLWDNGTMVDLNVFLPPNSDLTLNEAVFINSRGEISGFGTLLTARNTLS